MATVGEDMRKQSVWLYLFPWDPLVVPWCFRGKKKKKIESLVWHQGFCHPVSFIVSAPVACSQAFLKWPYAISHVLVNFHRLFPLTVTLSLILLLSPFGLPASKKSFKISTQRDFVKACLTKRRSELGIPPFWSHSLSHYPLSVYFPLRLKFTAFFFFKHELYFSSFSLSWTWQRSHIKKFELFDERMTGLNGEYMQHL